MTVKHLPTRINILAVDPSLVATAFCHPSGVTETVRPRTRGPERLYDLENMLLARCGIEGDEDAIQGLVPVSLVVMEGYSFHSKGKPFTVGELGGVFRLALWRNDIPLVVVPPKTVKKYATGRGDADKAAMIASARKAHTMSIRDDHQADAFWMWQIGLYHYDKANQWRVKVSADRRAALDKVEWVDLTTEGVR